MADAECSPADALAIFTTSTHIPILMPAWFACRALNLLLAGGDVQSAALLTPYKGQVRQLETELASRNFLFRGNPSVELVVSSIDGFQVNPWAEILCFAGCSPGKDGCCSVADTGLTLT